MELRPLLLRVCPTALRLGLGFSGTARVRKGASPTVDILKARSYPRVNSSCPALLGRMVTLREWIAILYSPLVTPDLNAKVLFFPVTVE